MNSMKKNCLVFGLLILLFVAFTTAASAQFWYPPQVPFYGYGYNYGYPPVPPGFGYFPSAQQPAAGYGDPYGNYYGQPYRGADVVSLTTLLLLGLLPTTTATTLLPATVLPTTTTTIGLTTVLLLGGVNTTTLLLLGI